MEDEIIQLRSEDGEEAAQEYMELCGMKESALDGLLETCSDILGL